MANNERNIPPRGGTGQRGMAGRSPRSRAAARPQAPAPRSQNDMDRDYSPDDDIEQFGNFTPGSQLNGGGADMEQTGERARLNIADANETGGFGDMINNRNNDTLRNAGAYGRSSQNGAARRPPPQGGYAPPSRAVGADRRPAPYDADPRAAAEFPPTAASHPAAEFHPVSEFHPAAEFYPASEPLPAAEFHPASKGYPVAESYPATELHRASEPYPASEFRPAWDMPSPQDSQSRRAPPGEAASRPYDSARAAGSSTGARVSYSGGAGGSSGSRGPGGSSGARGTGGSGGSRGPGGSSVTRGTGGTGGSGGARGSGGSSGGPRGDSRGSGGPRSGSGDSRSGARASGPGGARGGGRFNALKIVNFVLIALSLTIIIVIATQYGPQIELKPAAQTTTGTGTLPEGVLESENVYDGVHVSGSDVSGLTYDELNEFLHAEFGGSLANKSITLKINDVTKKLSFTELGVRYNLDEAAKQAYDIGRVGSASDRARKISEVAKNPINLQLVYTYDKDKVNELVNKISEEAGVLTEDAEVRYTASSVIIKPGREGVRVDKADLTERLREALDNFESAEIEVKLIMSQPNKLDAEKIYDTIYQEPVNAYFKVSDDHKSISVESEIPGQSVDRDKLFRAVEALNEDSSSEVTLALITVAPEIRKSDLSIGLFTDKLGSASTNFSVNSTNNKNRRDNMTLATKVITGHILAPGDEFGFNETVGRRTEANGYKMAGAFMNGQLIDDVGGGICQVSSTLYNAVLYADLAVTSRQNHSYIVGYVKPGFDATVSYPLPDFKFKNNTKYPIKINCGVEGTTISFSIYGTQVGPQKKITFSSEMKSTTEFTKVTTQDPTIPAGTTQVDQAGRTGYTYDTYKTVQIGDGPKETIKIATNKYKPMEQIERVGTKPVPPDEKPPEQIIIQPPAEEGDYISEPGQSGESQTGGQSGSGEAETTRPLRTPRPSNKGDATTTEAAATTTTQTTSESQEEQTRRTTTRKERTTAAAAENTTEAAKPTEAATKAPAEDGGGGSGDGGGGGGDAPKRTPRPARQ